MVLQSDHFFSLMLYDRKYPLGGSVVLISALLLLECFYLVVLRQVFFFYHVQLLGFQM